MGFRCLHHHMSFSTTHHSLLQPISAPFFSPNLNPNPNPSLNLAYKRSSPALTLLKAKNDKYTNSAASSSTTTDKGPKPGSANVDEDAEEGEYEEVEVSWIEEKAEDLWQMTGTAVNSIPGPRVGSTSLPWLLAVPAGYLGITFVIAVVKTIIKFNSPKAQRRRLVDKNAFLCKSINDYFPSRRLELDNAELKKLEKKTGFITQEILRKYIRYALNERPFNPDTVADLIHLRKTSDLEDIEIAGILNDVSRRIVKEKGPVLMDTRGLTEKGVKRKAAVQALFSKLLYLSELDEFCSTCLDSLQIKAIFGVTDEDANEIRIETLSGVADMESLEKMVSPEEDMNSEDEEE